MKEFIVYLICGFAGGLLRACQGGYKDSPYEPFLTIKFVRSLFFGTLGGIFWYFLHQKYQINIPPVLLIPLNVFFDSMCTEMYKRGIRVEDLSKYKMPTIFHINGHLIRNRFARILIILLVVGIVVSMWPFSFWLYKTLNLANVDHKIVGLIFGGIAGFMISVGGAMLDAAWEGFEPLKFFRSTYVGLFWGVIFSFFTTNPALLIYAGLGMDRMSIEFNKTFIKRMKSGKFKSESPTIPDWLEIREKIHHPYIGVWLLFVYLLAAQTLDKIF
jgi:hypothetical protein